MMHRTLQNLMGRAIIDKVFQNELLNGGREQTIAEFELTDAEKEAVTSIEAKSFEEFAGRLHGWIEASNGKPSDGPHILPLEPGQNALEGS